MSLRIKEIACVIIVLVFIGYLINQEQDSNKPVEEVNSSIINSIDMDSLVKKDKGSIKNEFALSPNDYEGIEYYACVDIMNVQEYLLIKVKSTEQIEHIKKQITSHIDAKIKLFRDYAIEQYNMLDNYILIVKGNYVLYAVYKDTNVIKNAFLGGL